MATSTLLLNVSRGAHWRIPNTTMPYEKFANIEIPRRKWTKYRYRIYDRWRLLNVVSISRVFFMSSMYTPEINLSLREKTWEDLELIDTTIEKPGHWMSYQFHHRVTVRNCVSFTVKSKVFQILTYQRQERPNEQYRNTVNDLLLPNTVSHKGEKTHTAALDDTAIPPIIIQITEIPLEKNCSIPQYRKPPCPPLPRRSE